MPEEQEPSFILIEGLKTMDNKSLESDSIQQQSSLMSLLFKSDNNKNKFKLTSPEPIASQISKIEEEMYKLAIIEEEVGTPKIQINPAGEFYDLIKDFTNEAMTSSLIERLDLNAKHKKEGMAPMIMGE